MLTYERQQSIFEYIKRHHSASVAELSEVFFFSQTTIRRDLEKLERAGRIRKTYGGAVMIQGDNEVIALEARSKLEKEAKSIIAKKAVSIIRENDVVFMDSSSTVLAMVPHLAHMAHVTVITNGLKLASELSRFPNISIYILGGQITSHTHSMHGLFAYRMLEEMHANIFFVSPKAVDRNGNIYCADADETQIRRLMMRESEKTVMMCNLNKLSQYASFRLCGLCDIDIMICETDPPTEYIKQLHDSGVILM